MSRCQIIGLTSGPVSLFRGAPPNGRFPRSLARDRTWPIAVTAQGVPLGRRMPHNAPHHLRAEAGEARCSRSGGCGCYAAFWLTQPLVVHFRAVPASRVSPNRTLNDCARL